jgi:hypothetical protein
VGLPQVLAVLGFQTLCKRVAPSFTVVEAAAAVLLLVLEETVEAAQGSLLILR